MEPSHTNRRALAINKYELTPRTTRSGHMHAQQPHQQHAQRTTAAVIPSSPSSAAVASASPKKKPARHVVTRQIFALPALQQFEPVLASSPRSYMVPTGAIPKIDKFGSTGTHSSSSNYDSIAAADSSRPRSRPTSRPTSGNTTNGAARPRPSSPAVVEAAPALRSVSPGALPQRPRGREGSPRVLRPQPPPPLGISARTDVDIYRYSQSAAQRMAIRPIFEQRKEDEAQIARQIIAQREQQDERGVAREAESVAMTAAATADRKVMETPRARHPDHEHQRRHAARAESETPPLAADARDVRYEQLDEPVQELTEITFVLPRSADARHSVRAGSGRDFEQSLLASEPQGAGGNDVSKTQSPNSSSGGGSVALSDTNRRDRGPKDPDSASGNSAALTDINTSVSVSITAATAATVTTALELEQRLVKPLAPGRNHEPFRAVKRDPLSSRAKDAALLSSQVSDTRKLSSGAMMAQDASERTQPARVLHKVLWRDLRAFDGCDTKLALLLSSEATAHITAAAVASSMHAHTQGTSEPVTTIDAAGAGAGAVEQPTTIAITESDISLSKQLRPDLRVLTPKWAEWMLARVQRDATGAFFLQIEDSSALASSRCFVDPCVVVDGCQLNIEMHVIGGTNLLVSVCDLGSGAASKVLLNSGEILELAAVYRRASIGESDADSSNSSGERLNVVTMLQDQAFLAHVATKSTVSRLGRKSGELNTHFSLRGARSDIDQAPDDASTDLDSEQSLPAPPVRCDWLPLEVFPLLLGNSALAAVAFLSQEYVHDAMLSVLRRFQQCEAVALHAKSYVLHHAASSSDAEFSDLIAAKVESAKYAKLKEIAVASIIEDMITELIAYESRVELYDAKYSGGYDDHYASKVQATYRMSTQRRQYAQKKFTRMRAARLLQALQRGIIARRRYCALKSEREKYLFYGFRSSLHATAAVVRVEDPKQRAHELAEETERKRQTFLMQVLDGYVAEHALPVPYRVSAALVETLFNEFGIVVGCPAAFGTAVAAYLNTHADSDSDSDSAVARDAKAAGSGAPHLHSSGEINAALLSALRSLYDDTFGLSCSTRRLDAGNSLPGRRARQSDPNEVPPRWLLKISAPFQRANRTRLAALRLSRKAAGRSACHLVATDFRNLLASESLAQFENCRAVWEANIRARRAEQRIYDSSNQDVVVQRALELVIASIKDWGVDPEPLFAGLNLCVRHRQGKDIVALVEAKFDAFAQGVNQLHGKRNILSLREELEQELEDFERILALRCLNIGRDHVVTVPPSEFLHLVLRGSIDDEYVRHALSIVLPVASIADKYALALKMVRAYAHAAYGDALLAICWSCLDVAENVTVEAAQLLDRITRADAALDSSTRELQHGAATRSIASSASSSQQQQRHQRSGGATPATSTPASTSPQSSVASRALYLLTGAQAVQFLHFVAKVAHFNRTTQRRALALLAPYAEHFMLHRVASAVAALDDYGVTVQLFDACFGAHQVYACTRLWMQFEELFGLDAAKRARASAPANVALAASAAGDDDDDGERSERREAAVLR